MREADWRHALKHLGRLAAAYPRLTRPRGLRAACLRKLNRKKEAGEEIAAALDVDGQDPFLRMESMFIDAAGARGKKLSTRAVKSLIEQVRACEPPLLEAAFDYLAVEMYDETESVLRIVPLGQFVMPMFGWFASTRSAMISAAVAHATPSASCSAPP